MKTQKPFDTAELENEIDEYKILREALLPASKERMALTIEIGKNNAKLIKSQSLKAEVEKSFNKLIEMFESVNEYSDAQYWVIEEKKRLGIK